VQKVSTKRNNHGNVSQKFTKSRGGKKVCAAENINQSGRRRSAHLLKKYPRVDDDRSEQMNCLPKGREEHSSEGGECKKKNMVWGGGDQSTRSEVSTRQRMSKIVECVR